MKRLASILLALLPAAAFAQLEKLAAPGATMIDTPEGIKVPSVIIWKADGSEMVFVPGGKSILGSGQSPTSSGNEAPVVEVTLPSFYIDKYEITNEQYMKFATEVGKQRPAITADQEFLLAPELPVGAIPWDAADHYARWAKKELPTEAMWEKAARGPSGTLFTTGDEPSPDKYIHGRRQVDGPVPAKESKGDVSGYGAVNMTGNIGEWVADWYAREAYSKIDSTDDPRGPADGDNRVVRGVSYLETPAPADFRATRRRAGTPTETRDDVGFRTVFVLRKQAPPTPTPEPEATPVPVDPMAALNAAIPKVAALLASGQDLPPDMIGRPNSAEPGDIGNLTPFNLKIAIINTAGKVTNYALPLPAGQFTRISVPFHGLTTRGYLFACTVADDGTTGELKNLGEFSAAAGLITLLRSNLFTDTLGFDGEPITVEGRKEAVHFYDRNYAPKWDEVEFRSTLEGPARLRLERRAPKATAPVETVEINIPTGALLSGVLTPGEWTGTIDYIGAANRSLLPFQFKIAKGFAMRTLVFSPDLDRTERVRVAARLMPMIKVTALEVRPPEGLKY